jgi:IS30 family transposase
MTLRSLISLFKQDLSADRISGRLGALYSDRKGKRVSPSTIYRYVYQETAKTPSLKVHFRQQQAKPRHRKGTQDLGGQIRDRVSIDERPNIVEQKSRRYPDEGQERPVHVKGFGKSLPPPSAGFAENLYL